MRIQEQKAHQRTPYSSVDRRGAGQGAENQEIYLMFSAQFEHIWDESKKRVLEYMAKKPGKAPCEVHQAISDLRGTVLAIPAGARFSGAGMVNSENGIDPNTRFSLAGLQIQNPRYPKDKTRSG